MEGRFLLRAREVSRHTHILKSIAAPVKLGALMVTYKGHPTPNAWALVRFSLRAARITPQNEGDPSRASERVLPRESECFISKRISRKTSDRKKLLSTKNQRAARLRQGGLCETDVVVEDLDRDLLATVL